MCKAPDVTLPATGMQCQECSAGSGGAASPEVPLERGQLLGGVCRAERQRDERDAARAQIRPVQRGSLQGAGDVALAAGEKHGPCRAAEAREGDHPVGAQLHLQARL